ncbi:MAG TPA: hypothetical protein VMT10_15110 [Solirubrobacteraceae bacterium]|nr:hypothetical protein [Solirubrobacteraceae bacterium]
MPRSTIRISLFALVAILLLALPGSAFARRHQRHAKTHHARVADRNRDGLPDAWEKANHLSLAVNQGPRDPDHDGLTNAAEFVAGTNPHKADSNGDGTPDGEQNAGTVASFTSGVLTINGFGGSTISGTVDQTTRIICRTLGQTRGDDQSEADDDAGSTPPHPAVIGSAASAGSEAGDDDGPGDDDRGDGHGQMAGCDATALVQGAVVHEADLSVTATGNVWREIKLVLNPPTAPTTAPTTTGTTTSG